MVERAELQSHSPMKSKKNLTRFTYETQTYEGWRLSITKRGASFTRYFSDKQFGGVRKSLAAAEKTLADLKAVLDGSKLVKGKLSTASIKEAQKVLDDAG